VLKATKQMVQAACLSDGIRARSVTKTEGESKIMNLSMTLFNSNNLYPFVYCFFYRGTACYGDMFAPHCVFSVDIVPDTVKL